MGIHYEIYRWESSPTIWFHLVIHKPIGITCYSYRFYSNHMGLENKPGNHWSHPSHASCASWTPASRNEAYGIRSDLWSLGVTEQQRVELCGQGRLWGGHHAGGQARWSGGHHEPAGSHVRWNYLWNSWVMIPMVIQWRVKRLMVRNGWLTLRWNSWVNDWRVIEWLVK